MILIDLFIGEELAKGFIIVLSIGFLGLLYFVLITLRRKIFGFKLKNTSEKLNI